MRRPHPALALTHALCALALPGLLATSCSETEPDSPAYFKRASSEPAEAAEEGSAGADTVAPAASEESAPADARSARRSRPVKKGSAARPSVASVGSVGVARSGSGVQRRAFAKAGGPSGNALSRRPRPDAQPPSPDPGGTFVHAGTNPFVDTREDKLSTFAVDVDTASYTYARRFLERGRRPSPGSIRVEEWVNAFHYDYAGPRGRHPFAVHMEAGPSPLAQGKHLLRVGVQGKRITNTERKPVHLTFLVDTSGSMRAHDKLPLAKKALHLLVENLRPDDSVGLLTYAGSTSQVLAQTMATEDNKPAIHRAIDQLTSGGGTAMGSGMEMAYQNANKHLGSESESRILVLSDGDANIGRTHHRAILDAVKGYVSEGITLSTIGFGTGNYRDHLMEQLADAGNGNYSYIDSMKAARKVFGEDITGTLQVIAQDVKIQVEMNDEVVKSYRLLGYENRDVADRDFRNDKVDAGEIGAGHSVTALYEVELRHPRAAEVRGDLATVRVRYKEPRGVKATEVAETFSARAMRPRFGDLGADTRFAAALSVAAEVLRGSPYAKELSLEDAWALAAEAAEGKYAAERRDFVELLDKTVKRESVAYRR